MKMVSSLLENVSGIQWYYIIGLLIFIPMFIIIVVRTLRMPAKEADEIKKSILTDNEQAKSSKK